MYLFLDHLFEQRINQYIDKEMLFPLGVLLLEFGLMPYGKVTLLSACTICQHAFISILFSVKQIALP